MEAETGPVLEGATEIQDRNHLVSSVPLHRTPVIPWDFVSEMSDEALILDLEGCTA